MNIEFENAEKEFNELANHYYEKNFGSLNKSDIDLLMFKFYIERLIELNKNDDGTINYSKISDYKIAKELGITPQRVRNLKIKKEMVYPQKNFEWKNSLRLILENEKAIRVGKDNIKVNIPDPNLFLAIQDYIEDDGGYVDIQLNSKILSVPIENFITLIELICNKDDYEKVNKIIKEECKKAKLPVSDKLSNAKMISEIVKNATGSISDIISWFSPVDAVSKAACNIITKIMEVSK